MLDIGAFRAQAIDGPRKGRQMTAAMTPRERVHRQIEHRPVDRLPLAFWGSYYGPQDPFYLRLLDFFGFPFEPERQFRRKCGHTVTYMDDRILEALAVDTRYVWCGATDVNSPDFSSVDPQSTSRGSRRSLWRRFSPDGPPGTSGARSISDS